jgi:hypothetical protein
MLDQLTSHDFLPHLQEKFYICLPSLEKLEIELIEVSEWGANEVAKSQQRRPFSLIFRGAREPVLPQKIYTIAHATLGTLEIFLVPIGPDLVGMCYQAIFT